MTENATLKTNEPILDETFMSQIKDVFAAESAQPGKSALNFIYGFAAAFESLQNDLFGTVAIMKN